MKHELKKLTLARHHIVANIVNWCNHALTLDVMMHICTHSSGNISTKPPPAQSTSLVTNSYLPSTWHSILALHHYNWLLHHGTKLYQPNLPKFNSSLWCLHGWGYDESRLQESWKSWSRKVWRSLVQGNAWFESSSIAVIRLNNNS